MVSNASTTLHKGVWTCSWSEPLILNATLFTSAGCTKYSPKVTKIRVGKTMPS